MPSLTFDGRLTVNGRPASGQEVLVLAGPELRLLAICGRTTTDGSGHYSVTIDPRDACTDRGNSGGPVNFIFAWKGQQVGVFGTHYRPEPNRSDLVIRNLDIFIPYNLLTLSDVLSVTDTPYLVPRRYYGQVTVQGEHPQGEMWISVKNGSYPCGTAFVQFGRFYLDIDDDEQCASPRTASGWKPVVLTFLIDGRHVWKTSVYLRHELPTTLGKAAPTPTLTADWWRSE